jgi:uncharacterized membrane protein YebE (DUF533 family)
MESEAYGSPLAVLYLADLLMGAAYSDSHLDGKEVARVKEILAQVSGGELSPTVQQRIDTFNPTAFNAESTVRLMIKEIGSVIESKEEKKKILEFVASVHEVDEEFAFEEDEYLHKVAGALGLDPADYGDLSLEIISVEEIQPVIDKMNAPPPPVPEK